jgi:hypothetical protein
MKHLKTYKLFESVISESEFPTELDIQELFYDLTDEEPLSKCHLYESGYQIFTTDKITRPIRSQLLYDMSFEENWINKECEDTQDIWKNMFINLSEPLSNDMIKVAVKNYDDVYFSEVKKSKNGIFQVDGKGYLEKLQENIINDIIPGYPIMYLNLGLFNPDKLPLLVECLQRLYEVTGFRPTSSVWAEDYVDEETGDLVTFYGADLQLYKVNDIEYNNLCKIIGRINPNNKTQEVTKHFL